MPSSSIKNAIKQREETLFNNLAKDFSISGINKSPARFNLKKLQDINAQFIRMMSLEEFVFRAHCSILKISYLDKINITAESPFCFVLENSRQNDAELPQPDHEIITQYCAWYLDKNRITVLSEIGTESKCILAWNKPQLEEVQWKKSTVPESVANLKEIKQFILETYKNNPHQFPHKIDQIEHYMKESSAWWETQIKTWLEKNSYGAGDYLWPLRVTLSGQQKSPSPFELLSILTKEETNQRINTVCN